MADQGRTDQTCATTVTRGDDFFDVHMPETDFVTARRVSKSAHGDHTWIIRKSDETPSRWCHHLVACLSTPCVISECRYRRVCVRQNHFSCGVSAPSRYIMTYHDRTRSSGLPFPSRSLRSLVAHSDKPKGTSFFVDGALEFLERGTLYRVSAPLSESVWIPF